IGQRKDGTELPMRMSVAEMTLPGHRVFVGILHDLTDEKRQNEEHLQAQKMEALGRLAGGIAHDFNNLLTIIIGNNERIQAGVEEGGLCALLEQNQNAAERGGALTRRLLSFAHRSRLEPTILHLNDRVTNMMDMLHRTIGEGIVVTSAMEPDLWHIRVDPGEVDHALLNLMLNARDAMPSGGKVTIETANETFSAGGTPVDLAPGDYVRLSVVDTGVGMTPDVLKRAVEPFFTTKRPGKGTGLGLASAYGFARQSDGCLVVASEVGKGTTVSLYLPRASGEVPLPASADELDIPMGDGKLVLVVDDDDEVREVTLKRLESLGYAVIEAASGPKAIERYAGKPVALALIDIVMPGGLSGYEVADKLRKLNLGIKVLLTTGYDSAGRKKEPEAAESFKVLEKPYTRAELARAVAEALAG
ncbi:MAG: hybrid sensor histidine kinase/response regulator, partial [Ramlibacter sp.]|nr:hybrid sensor histidine kinase/response regulator [Ramlibacter sp.]